MASSPIASPLWRRGAGPSRLFAQSRPPRDPGGGPLPAFGPILAPRRRRREEAGKLVSQLSRSRPSTGGEDSRDDPGRARSLARSLPPSPHPPTPGRGNVEASKKGRIHSYSRALSLRGSHRVWSGAGLDSAHLVRAELLPRRWPAGGLVASHCIASPRSSCSLSLVVLTLELLFALEQGARCGYPCTGRSILCSGPPGMD